MVREKMIDRTNYRLNGEIEKFIDTYDGTAIGQEVLNMYENGSEYESICEKAGIDYDDFREE